MTSGANSVHFIDDKLQKAFRELKSGRFEERQLAEWVERAACGLSENPFAGVNVPKRLWPKEYVWKFLIRHLRKYNLPHGWRLLYTIRTSRIEIVLVLLEWLSHKEYEKRFGYNVK